MSCTPPATARAAGGAYTVAGNGGLPLGQTGFANLSLALAILLAVTDAETAERCYQRFKWSVLAPIEADRWLLDGDDVRRWLGRGPRCCSTDADDA